MKVLLEFSYSKESHELVHPSWVIRNKNAHTHKTLPRNNLEIYLLVGLGILTCQNA